MSLIKDCVEYSLSTIRLGIVSLEAGAWTSSLLTWPKLAGLVKIDPTLLALTKTLKPQLLDFPRDIMQLRCHWSSACMSWKAELMYWGRVVSAANWQKPKPSPPVI